MCQQQHAIMERSKFTQNHAANIKFSNLTYKIMETLKKSKTIINGASGQFCSGELTAILGPSGSGKSTLLNLLAGYRIQPDEGHIEVNNQPLERNAFRKISRYVLQQDLICPYFTIEETLMFASHFKCPSHHSQMERREQVNRSLEDFRLQQQANSMISKISGGELKRLSIALEMLDNPSILFLDEPTTGLDESSAMQCIVQLKHLAQSGRTIVCSIHSPSARLMALFDKNYILAEGQCIYQGRGRHIVAFLESITLNCPLTYNPADFIIEVATFEYGNYHVEMVGKTQNGQVSEWLPEAETSELHDNAKSLRSYGDVDLGNCEAILTMTTRTIPWISEFKCLLMHNMKQMRRDKTNLKLRILIHLFISALIGWAYLGVGKNAKYAMFNYHLCLLSVVMCAFISMTPMFAHVAHEMHYLRRQHFNQWYRLETWFLALLTAQLPITCIMTTICTILIYTPSGHPMDLFRIALFGFIMMLTTFVGIGYGVLIGSRLRLMNALFMGPCIFAVFAIFSNLSIEQTEIPLIKRILMSVSFVRHAMEGMLSALFQYNRSDLECNDIFCIASKPVMILQVVGFSDISSTRAVLCLVAFYVAFCALAFVTLKLRLNPLGLLGRNRYYRYVKHNMSNYFNFGVKV